MFFFRRDNAVFIDFLQLSGKFPHAENCIEQTWDFSVQSPDWKRIRTGPDFQIQCIRNGKQ